MHILRKRRNLVKHGWRGLALISLLASACQPTPAASPATPHAAVSAANIATSPPPAATSTSMPATPILAPTTAPTLAPTPTCPPPPAALPSQEPAPLASPVEVAADGRVVGRVLPTPYLTPAYVRAPIAWTRSTGKGVTVGVARSHDEDLALVGLIAPDAQVAPLAVNRQMRVGGAALLDALQEQDIRLLALLDPGDFDPQVLESTVPALIQAGIAVFVNADLNPGAAERSLVNALEASGAITVGRLKYGVRIQGKDTLNRQINLFAGYGEENFSSDRGSVLTVAAVGALVLAGEPSLDPAALKQRLIETGDRLYTGVNPLTNQTNNAASVQDPQTGDFSPSESAYWFRRVNAAAAVGVHLAERWPQNALNAPAAWKTATGQGVVVGVLDRGFYPDNPALKDHIIDLFPRSLAGQAQGFPHGTAMAKAVLSVAPDASLVFLYEPDGVDYARNASNLVPLIDYATQHGIRVITNSDMSWINTPDVHAAIDRAVEAGIVFVSSDYTGPNDAVIRAGDWRWPGWEVGALTFFLDDDRPSEREGGLSFAGPQIAGIAALILQNEPGLTPAQVKQRILGTATALSNGASIADAAAAVENRPSGRRLERDSGLAAASVLAESSLRVVYQPQDEPVSIELGEGFQSWPIASRPRQDILLYREAAPKTGANPVPGADDSRFRLVASRDYNPVLIIEWSGKEGVSGDWPATLMLLPGGEWRPFFTVELGEGDTPPLHVEVTCSQVRLSWSSPGGAPMDRAAFQGFAGQPSSSRILSLELETVFMPELVDPMY